MRNILSSSRFAGICALLALVVALSGTAYAAATLARNSVGTPQLKKQAVTTAKLKKNAVTTSRIRNGTVGSADLAPGVVPDQPITGELPSGSTQRGFISMFATADADFEAASDSIAFPFALPSNLSGPDVHRINPGEPAPPECPGSFGFPEADPGNLCIYVQGSSNVGANNVNGPAADDSASRFGFTYFIRSAASGNYSLRATWAVTAP